MVVPSSPWLCALPFFLILARCLTCLKGRALLPILVRSGTRLDFCCGRKRVRVSLVGALIFLSISRWDTVAVNEC